MPPAIPAIRPENKGAFDPRAIPRQSGSATKKTTTDAGKSAPRLLKTLRTERAIKKGVYKLANHPIRPFAHEYAQFLQMVINVIAGK
jgi:hypothetical protein